MGVILCLSANYSFSQIHSQGKNINKEHVYSITVELEPKPHSPGKFHAFIDFYGRRKEVKWYLKSGVEHKAFDSKDDMIAYLEDNGWFYLKTEVKRTSKLLPPHKKYYFRKSMDQLAREYSELAHLE